MSNELVVTAPTSTSVSIFSTNSFEGAVSIAEKLSKSDLVPANYRGKPENCLIALDMANRTKTPPFAVMQSLNIIKGRPSWSSAFIISVINTCGRFASVLKFENKDCGSKEVECDLVDDRGYTSKQKVTIDNKSCRAYALDKVTKEKIEGPEITMEMAVAEGWYFKTGSKWKTMPDVMLQYRAAAFFGRLYCPDLLMGMHTEDEVIDAEFSIEDKVPELVTDLQPVEPKKTRAKKTKEPVAENEAEIFHANNSSDLSKAIAKEECKEVEAELIEEEAPAEDKIPACAQPRDLSEDDGFSNFGD